MPLQNRVTPTGEIVAHGSRGLMMGNRGCLHGQGRGLGVSRWRSKLWICCLPAPAGPVEVLTPPSIVAAITAGYPPLVHHSALMGDRPPGVRIQGSR